MNLQYELWSSPDEQLIPYRKREKWGFCNKYKKIKINCIYDMVYPFSEGLAFVKWAEEYYFIDRGGNKKVYFKEDDEYKFEQDGHMLMKRFKNNTIQIVSKKTNKYGVINNVNVVIVDCLFSKIEFFEKYLVAKDENQRKWIYSNQGELINKDSFTAIFYFNEGLARVYRDTTEGSKYGFIDETGKLVIECKFTSRDFMDNLDDEDFSCGLAFVVLGGKTGLIDKTGNWRFDSDTKLTFKEGLAIAWVHPFRAGEYKFINTRNEIEYIGSYDYVDEFSEGYCIVKRNGKFGYIDKLGNLTINFIYESAKAFKEGLALVQLDKKWGAINKEGLVIIDFKYDADFIFPDDFNNGRVNLKFEQKWYQLNTRGEIIIDGIYNGLKILDQTYTEVVCYNNKYIPFPKSYMNEYKSFSSYLENKRENYRYGLVSKNGSVVIPLNYNFIEKLENNLLMVNWKNNSGHDYIDLNGRQYWED